jgi:hypothetical protein
MSFTKKLLLFGLACMVLSVLVGIEDRLAIVMAQVQMEGPIFVPVPHNVTHHQLLANQSQTSQQPLRLTPEQSDKVLGKKLDKMNELLANISAELRVLISNNHAR